MSMRPAVLAVVILATVAPRVGAGQVVDGTSNTILFSELAAQPVERVKAPGLPWMRYDVVARLQNPEPLIGVSPSAAGLAVHSGSGGSAPVTTALFFAGTGSVANAPFTLRDQGTGVVTLPTAVRTLAVDPSDPGGGAALLSASHTVLPGNNKVRGVHLIRDAAGEAVLVDYDFLGGLPRRTPLGVTAPVGPAKGSVVASPDGRSFATLASADGVALYELGDFAGPGPLQPALLGTIPVGASFDPGSTHPGIIAVLIALLGAPASQAPQVAPSISIQDGSVLRLFAYDGVELRLVAEQGLAAGTQGLIEEEGIYYYFVSQGVLWRGIVGGGPGAIVKLGR